MGGPTSINGYGGGVFNVGLYQEGLLDDVNTATTNAAQKASTPQVEADIDGDFNAAALDELNRMLGRAAASTFESVSRQSLESLLKDSSLKGLLQRLDGGAQGVLDLAAKNGRLMHKLDSVKGMEGFQKMFEAKGEPLYLQAMEAQMELGDRLADIINMAARGDTEISDELFSRLEDMQYKCISRSAEISRWGSQMEALYREHASTGSAQTAQKGGTGSVDGFTFDTKVTDALAELSGKMHGTGDSVKQLASSSSQITDFLKTLDSFRQSQETGKVSQADQEKLARSAAEMSRALKELANSGTADRALLKQLADNLDRGMTQNTRRQHILRTAALRTIDYEMKLPPTLQTLKKVPQKILKKYLPSQSKVLSLLEAHDRIVKGLSDLAEYPAAEKRAEKKAEIQKSLAENMSQIFFKDLEDELNGIGKKLDAFLDDAKKSLGNDDDCDDLDSLKHASLTDLRSNRSVYKFANNLGISYGGKADAVMQMLERRGTEAVWEGVETKAFLESVFHGDYPVSSLVETRIHGVADEDIQLEADDARLVDSQALGAGAANEVTLCEYAGGTKLVFKPEYPGENGLHSLLLGKGDAYSNDTKVYHLNIASRKCAEAFGLEKQIVTSKAGVLKGQFGFFMELAKGDSVALMSNVNDMKDRIAAKADKESLMKSLFFQFNDLQWLDLLTGQGDRHADNFKIHISDNPDDSSVTLKGIDNDACFTDTRVGANKFVLTAAQYKSVQADQKALSADITKTAIDEEKKAWKECFQELGGGRYLADVDKMRDKGLPNLVMATRSNIGFQSCAMPSYVSTDLYEKLMRMKNDSGARSEMLASLGNHLSQNALDATGKRLDELIAHAEKLKAAGAVIDRNGDGWKKGFEDARKLDDAQMEVMDSKYADHDINLLGEKMHVKGKANALIFKSDYFLKFVTDRGLDPDNPIKPPKEKKLDSILPSESSVESDFSDESED